jgi:ABC-type phosphate transport system substrate-binding protein
MEQRTMNRLLLMIGLSLFGATAVPDSRAASEDLVVIVNKTNPLNAIDRDGLRPIFQTTQARWPHGKAAVPFNLPEESSPRKIFDAAVLGLDPEGVARYWTDRKIRGGERPPRKLSTPSAVVRAIGEDEGGVGYVSPNEANGSVKIIARVHNGQVTAP